MSYTTTTNYCHYYDTAVNNIDLLSHVENARNIIPNIISVNNANSFAIYSSQRVLRTKCTYTNALRMIYARLSLAI